jgi:diguanylate cyclase (GGDEF)-like protein
LALGTIVLVELLGRPPGVEPVALVALLVIASAVISGMSGGVLAASIGSVYAVYFYWQPAWAGVAGNDARVALTVMGAATALFLTATLRDRVERARTRAARQADLGARVQAFTLELANEPSETMPDAVVLGAASLLDTDMCVLTLLDPPTGRHFVRAVHGGGASAIGVEVIPGVGVTGQALRERRTVFGAAPVVTGPRRGLRSWIRNASSDAPGPPQVVAAVPALQAGRVIATLTVGRSDAGRPFDEDDMAALALVSPVVTLAVSGSLQRLELEQGSPRDALTGLYNRAYLDAAMDQLLALRRRVPPDDRPPLSLIMFDIDSFRLLNERHGRQVGDTVLRAVSTLLRQRFRASDILARVGPDSFFVVLNGAGAESAAEAAAQIRRQVRELNVSNARGEPVIASISAGCAMFHDGDRPDALVRSVEAALETARWSGPGAVVSI